MAASCSSASACTAVAGLFADRWDGVRWSVKPVATPAFSATALDFLSGVTCSARSACMAVGTERPPPAANADYDYTALAEVWNGTTWSDQSPAVSQAVNAYFEAVSCTSASRCIAVGQNVASALAMAWDGSSWTVQLAPVPPPVMSNLDGVSCTSISRCTAVGYMGANESSPFRGLVEAWNGIAWSIVPTPKTPALESTVLNSVSCVHASCTAVGSVGYRQLVERWNGRRWSIQRPPKDSPGTALNGVSCVSPGDCVAVGALTHRAFRSVAEHWNGHRWSVEPTPTPAGGSVLWAVSCVSAQDCVAVGQRPHAPLIERWNGTRWSIQSTS